MRRNFYQKSTSLIIPIVVTYLQIITITHHLKSSAAANEVQNLLKCCKYQGMIQISKDTNCPRCVLPVHEIGNGTNTKYGVLELEYPSLLWDRFGFELNEIHLDTSTPTSTCQAQMNRVTLSSQQLQSNLTKDGFLRLGRHGIFPKTTFCVDRLGPTHAEILIPQNGFKINKCCGLNSVFDVKTNQCTARKNQGLKKPVFVPRGRRNNLISGMNRINDRTDVNHRYWDSHFSTNYSYTMNDNWIGSVLQKNGHGLIKNFTNRHCWNQIATRFIITSGDSESELKLTYESNDGVFLRGASKTIANPDFCIETVQNYDGICTSSSSGNQDLKNIGRYKNYYNRVAYGYEHNNDDGLDNEIVIVFYLGDDADALSVSYATLMGCIWMITSGFLFIAAIVNVAIIQRNVHGWVLFSYLMSSALLNIVAGIFIMMVNDDKDKVGCNFIDFVQKFLYLSTLCWMTSINFDLWYAFRVIHRKLEPTVQNSSKRFPFYILFSWSLPILIIVLGWFIGTRNRSIDGKPIEIAHCIIYDFSIILYMSGPVVVLIGVNLILFVRTVMIIRGLRNASQKILQRSCIERESFKLFTKLFLMTGPIWILRIVLLGLQIKGTYLTWYGCLIELVFVVPDIAFFLLVILHRKVIERLQIRFPCCTAISCCISSNNFTRANCTNNSGMSPTKNGGPASATISRATTTVHGGSRSNAEKGKRVGSICMMTFDGGQGQRHSKLIPVPNCQRERNGGALGTGI